MKKINLHKFMRLLLGLSLSLSILSATSSYTHAAPHISNLPSSILLDEQTSTLIQPTPYLSTQNASVHNSLLPYVMPSPDQFDAGSCLYMALTGIAEWWLAKLNPRVSRQSDGPLDLSERYLMNLAGLEESENGVENWKTDTILLFNEKQRAALNRDYRYTQGWYTSDEEGDYIKAQPHSSGASYGTPFNWIQEALFNQVPLQARLPKFSRDVIFADPESNQWNVGVAPSYLPSLIRNYLDRNNSPLLIIYNHAGYWHAVGVYGYDRNAETDCKFVNSSLRYFRERSTELKEEARNTPDPDKKESLLKLADKLERTGIKANDAYERNGGCNKKGVFYVRDSIYSDSSEALYDYDLSNSGEEAHYSKRIILRSESFMQVLVNHAVGIYAQPY